SESEQSDETLYLINEEARARTRFSGVDSGNVNGDFKIAIQDTALENTAVEAETEGFPEDGLEGEGFDSVLGEGGGWENGLDLECESVTKEADEEALLAEETESKKVWSKGRIEFNSSDEEEVLVRLIDRKQDGKRRVDLRPKNQPYGRKPPCIEGRTLATRTLRLGEKSKLR
ncbi:hypothetical protein PIB30_092623, partial [Stylosanthes scabra]|nr:hypothetical protein [Stylosanthes scabra]